ncbi:MAG: hypothetical protein JNK37_07520 [Verrucomicrobiales bacterium]|nr:hypothetical protein [Verrucomicrobiales bacterium]
MFEIQEHSPIPGLILLATLATTIVTIAIAGMKRSRRLARRRRPLPSAPQRAGQ